DFTCRSASWPCPNAIRLSTSCISAVCQVASQVERCRVSSYCCVAATLPMLAASSRSGSTAKNSAKACCAGLSSFRRGATSGPTVSSRKASPAASPPRYSLMVLVSCWSCWFCWPCWIRRALSAQLVPGASATALLRQMPLLHQRPEVLLERIAVAAGQANGFGHGDAAMLAREFDDLQCQLRQLGQHQLLALDLAFQATYLLGQRTQEEHQPGLPIRCI